MVNVFPSLPARAVLPTLRCEFGIQKIKIPVHIRFDIDGYVIVNYNTDIIYVETTRHNVGTNNCLEINHDFLTQIP